MGRRYLQPTDPRVIEASRLAAEGLSIVEIAAKLAVTRITVKAWAGRFGFTILRKQRQKENGERNARFVSMYQQGLTLEQIGEHFHLTRERIRQILARQGIAASEGGSSVRAAAKRASKRATQDARCLTRWGCTYGQYMEWRGKGYVRRYCYQENAAKSRGIPFRIKLAQWVGVWEASGKWDERGRGKGRYVMSRIKDDGCYEVGNVHIQLATENSREAVEKWRGVVKEHRGVHCLYPGTTRPYVVKVQKRNIGRFATAEEGAAFRAQYIKDNAITLGNVAGNGRGWTLVKSPKDKPYMAQAMGANLGNFATAEEATAAYQAHVQGVLAERAAQAVKGSVVSGHESSSGLVHAANCLASH